MVWSREHKLQNGKYIIKEKLGKGFFGVTFKAKDTSAPNKFVAIKIPNYYDQNSFDERQMNFNKELNKVFTNEIKSIAPLLNHENLYIVKFFESFHENDVPCIVMEFVEGESLDNLAKNRGALPEQEAIKYIKEVAEGLIFLHSKDLIHRDVHPGNILINQKKAIVIDFGLARNSQSLYFYVAPTYAHQVYAPPEQQRGSRKPSVDIYSLSATLYYAITAQEPPSAYDFLTPESKRKSKLENSLNEKKISDSVRDAILKGMELNPEKRPQSIEEWLKLLSSPTKKGVDYTRLEGFLKTGQWKKADIETYEVMLKATGREDSLSIESIKDFPCTDLCTIDQLWVKNSSGRFGFSVQKSIWDKVDQNIVRYGDNVGWRKGLWWLGEKWIKHSQLTFNIEAPLGHLPAIRLDNSDPDEKALRNFITVLFSRVKACRC